MNLQQHVSSIAGFKNLELLANQVVEGFISGMHKSPFHGFSAEFSEHKIYNPGESTKNIDWKLFARTDRLYTKQYEEETNMRCHIIIDNSSSMHYPKLKKTDSFLENKIGFSVMASAVLMNLLKKQRDAVGLSIYAEKYDFYTTEKGSDRHYRMLYHILENVLETPTETKQTNTAKLLHQIAENIHKRSMIVLFTDFFQSEDNEVLFKALEHLKHNKHKVVVFHVFDKEKELQLNFDGKPKKFVDVETGETIQVFSDTIKDEYEKVVADFFKKTALICAQYKIKYVPVAIQDSFEKIMTSYLIEKQRFR